MQTTAKSDQEQAVSRSATETAAAVIAAAAEGTCEKQLVDDAVAAVVAAHGSALVDSHRLADAFFKRRVNADPVQTRNYVQYVLRVAPHVCGHAEDGGMYRVHEALECSDACKERWAHTAPATERPVCGTCFTTVTTTGVCAMGCDD